MKSRILITEDELIVRMHLKSIVQELGHEVVGTAATKDEALAAAEAEPPDVVLMDIHLAEGTDGVETARELRERHDCEVVFITAYADSKTVDRTSEVEASGYLVKPFSNASVRAALQTAVNTRGQRQRAKAREASLTSALEQRNETVLVANQHGTVLFASPGTSRLTGLAPQASVGRELGEVFRPAGESGAALVTAAIARVLDSGEKSEVPRLEVPDPGGAGTVLVDLAVRAVREEGQRPTGVMLTIELPPDGTAPSQNGNAPGARPPAPFGKDTCLLVYSHDTFGLGHLRRCHNIVRQLGTDYPELSTLLVTGPPMVHRFVSPPGTDYLKLPAVRKVAPEQYEARSLSMSGSSIHALRTNLLLPTVRDYLPDVVLVDHSPLGMRGEMLPAMRWLKENTDCTLILGLRDIIDRPDAVERSWKEQGIYDVLREIYDHIVVYGAPEVFETGREYRFPDDVLAKTHYMNYVSDPRPGPTVDEPSPDGERLVVVTAGGGDGGAGELIEPFLTMLRDHPPEVPGGGRLRAVVLTGPFVEPALKERLHELAQGLPADVKDFVPSTRELFQQADLCLSTCGYNTMTELLVNARRSILVPRVLHRDEQLIRARRMDELGLATCLHPDDVTPQVLSETIARALAAPAPLTEARRVGRVPFDGTECLSRFLGTLQVRASSRARA